MLDDDKQLQTLFSRIGQVVVFGQYLTSALHACCSQILIVQGFDEEFARAMMSHQEPQVVRRTWTELLRQRFKDEPESLKLIDRLSVCIDEAAAACKELVAHRWLSDTDRLTGFSEYNALDGFTLNDGGVNFDRLILDLTNLATALRLLSGGIETADAELMERLWGLVGR